MSLSVVSHSSVQTCTVKLCSIASFTLLSLDLIAIRLWLVPVNSRHSVNKIEKSLAETFAIQSVLGYNPPPPTSLCHSLFLSHSLSVFLSHSLFCYIYPPLFFLLSLSLFHSSFSFCLSLSLPLSLGWHPLISDLYEECYSCSNL